MNKSIMISGPDGVGKSSIAEKLKNYYESEELSVELVWVRFNHYLQKIINFFGRVLGKSYDEQYKWGRDNYHDYQGFFGLIYIFAAYIDHLIFKIFFRRNLFKNKQICILDRYIIDMVADLIVDTENTSLVLLIFNSFIKEELQNFKTYIIECDRNIVISRRNDISDDKKYLKKIEAYKLIASKYSIDRIDTSTISLNEAVEKIIK